MGDIIEYNVIKHLKTDEEIDNFCKEVIHKDNQFDPFWDDMAEYMLKSMIYYLLSCVEESDQTLSKCLELAKKSETIDNNYYKGLINDLPIDHKAKFYYKNIEILPEKTYASIVKTLEGKLEKCVS